jgi:EAL domain-containing protein (putative c-di-GMP-specific phosphodiesterase class I)
VVGLEALLRWQHPDLGIILPGEFISLAEESGLNYAIGDWVLQEVCNQVASWQRVGIIQLRIANNGSPVQFAHSDLIENVLVAIKNKCLVPNHLGCDRAKDIYLPGRCRPSRYWNSSSLGIKKKI